MGLCPACDTSDQRAADLPVRTDLDNWHRPHAALNSKPPISRLGPDRNNLLRFHCQGVLHMIAFSRRPEYVMRGKRCFGGWLKT